MEGAANMTEKAQISAIGSAEDLPPRFRPNPRRADSARSARIRADSRESAAEVLPPSQ